jgi:hypothetical protein
VVGGGGRRLAAGDAADEEHESGKAEKFSRDLFLYNLHRCRFYEFLTAGQNEGITTTALTVLTISSVCWYVRPKSFKIFKKYIRLRLSMNPRSNPTYDRELKPK